MAKILGFGLAWMFGGIVILCCAMKFTFVFASLIGLTP